MLLILQLCNNNTQSQLYYKGVQITPSFPPYYPYLSGYNEFSFSPEDITFLLKNKINLIQLNLMMPGVFPQNITPNTVYLDQIQRIIDSCELNNISVVLSFYQSKISELNCGQGFPSWLVSRFIADDEIHEYPYPQLNEIKREENGTISQEICKNIDTGSTYFNREEFTDVIKDFWNVIIDRFDNSSAVIGYVPFTEPGYGEYLPLVNKDLLPSFYTKIISSMNTSKTMVIQAPINNTFDGFSEIFTDKCIIYDYIDDSQSIELFKQQIKRLDKNCNDQFIVGQFGKSMNKTFLQLALTEISKQTWIYHSYKQFGAIDQQSLIEENGIISILNYPYFSNVFGADVNQQFYFPNQSLQIKFTTGELSKRSRLQISEDWKLFATNVRFVLGQDAVKIVLENGQISLENIIENEQVDVTIW